MERGEVGWAGELTQGLVKEKGVMSTAVCLPLHCAEPKGNEMMSWGYGCGSVGRTACLALTESWVLHPPPHKLGMATQASNPVILDYLASLQLAWNT